ncbi:MAG TPA: hypothetical protein VGD17_07035 [Chitinophagaceae bacterium]
MKTTVLAFVLLSLTIACSKERDDKVIVIATAGDISASVDEFRKILGSKLNTAPGAIGGRREVNWDAVPDDMIGKPLPMSFLNNTEPGAPVSSQRGFEYEAGSGTFQVSKSNFSDVNPEVAGEFNSFSGSNTFTNISSSLWDGRFEVPGEDVPATIQGFGMVFSDVDVANLTSIEFFNEGRSLGKFFAPVQQPGSKLSFLGVYFKDQRITRIRVQHGNGSLNKGEKDASDGGSNDLVVLDDFLYDEPVKK